MQWFLPWILVSCRLGRHAMRLACPQALWDSVQPHCFLSGAEHTPGTLTCHGRAESQWNLPPPLAAAVVAALGQPAGFVLFPGPEAWLGLGHHSLPILPVRMTNPTCPPFSLQGSEPLPRLTTLCQNPFMNPARITTALSGVRSRVSDLPTVLGNNVLAF